MNINKSLYRINPSEIVWVVWEGSEENKKSIIDWAEKTWTIEFTNDEGFWEYRTIAEYVSDWTEIKDGSILVANVTMNIISVVPIDETEDFYSRLIR